jgi:hypothetical protein
MLARHARRVLPCAAAFALLAAVPPAAFGAHDGSKQQVYKWTDEKGVVHYGDAVPPQYADQDKTLLNSQGVAVGTIPGRRTPEQLAAEAARQAAEERARQDAQTARVRDQNLLATYLTVDEITALRDRRVEILEGQAKAQGQSLEQLRGRQRQLELQTQHFRPYNTAANAQLLPERLAEDVVRTAIDIHTQERNLELKRAETARLKEQFERDIVRFRELKKVETEYARSPQPR